MERASSWSNGAGRRIRTSKLDLVGVPQGPARPLVALSLEDITRLPRVPNRKRYVSLGKLDRMTQRLHLNRPSRIYGGDFWFQANRKAIDHLLDDPSIPSLIRSYRSRENPKNRSFKLHCVASRNCESPKTTSDTRIRKKRVAPSKVARGVGYAKDPCIRRAFRRKFRRTALRKRSSTRRYSDSQLNLKSAVSYLENRSDTYNAAQLP